MDRGRAPLHRTSDRAGVKDVSEYRGSPGGPDELGARRRSDEPANGISRGGERPNQRLSQVPARPGDQDRCTGDRVGPTGLGTDSAHTVPYPPEAMKGRVTGAL